MLGNAAPPDDVALILEEAEEAIKLYARMSNFLDAPWCPDTKEGFIRAFCAVNIFKRTNRFVTVETPKTIFTSVWNIPKESLVPIETNFRVDMLIYGLSEDRRESWISSVIEFKRWGNDKIAKDVHRVRTLVFAIRAHCPPPWANDVTGYIIVCPQYEAHREHVVTETINNISQRWAVHGKPHQFAVRSTAGRDHGFAGVVAIDAMA